MSKLRLSKLQKTILLVIADPNNSCYCNNLDMLRYEVERKKFGIMASYVGGVKERNKNIFSASFSRSIKNLKKKELVRFTYKSEHWNGFNQYGNLCKNKRIKRIYLTDSGLKLITVINNKEIKDGN